MKILLWSLYKNESVNTILYALIADLILEKQIRFEKGKIVFADKNNLPKIYRQLLKKLTLNKEYSIKNREIQSLLAFEQEECEREKLLRMYPIIGPVWTGKCRKEIMALEQEEYFKVFSRFIETGRKDELSVYFKNLDKIIVQIKPGKMNTSNSNKMYNDMQQAIRHKNGIF